METRAFLGALRRNYNPAMDQYIYTWKDGISIIDLVKTKLQSRKAKSLYSKAKRPLIVDSTTKWKGGTLTNRQESPYKKLPDLVVIVDPTKQYTALAEAQKLDIPTIVIADTDARPYWSNLVVPVNVRNRPAVELIINYITKEVSN